MKVFDFPPLTESVKLRFICPKCGQAVVTKKMMVPFPNYEGDTREKSLVTKDYEEVCPICGESYNITVGESNCGGEGWVDELDENVDVEVFDTPIRD